MHLRTRYTERLPQAPGLRLDVPLFEGSGTKALDLSGKGNHGTIHDAVWTRDVNGVCMSFNGTSAYIDCGNDASLNITDAITIEMWVKRIGGGGYLISKNDTSFSDNQYGIYVNGDNPTYYPSGTPNAGTGTVPAGVWTHVVFTRTGGIGQFYINGAASGSPAACNMPTKPTFPVRFGCRWNTTVPTLIFNGVIDEVRIYAVALTASQIKRRYEQTKRDYVRAS